MYKEDLILNNLQCLICHKTQPNPTQLNVCDYNLKRIIIIVGSLVSLLLYYSLNIVVQKLQIKRARKSPVSRDVIVKNSRTSMPFEPHLIIYVLYQ